MIAQSDVDKLIRAKKDMYDAMLRNHWHLPSARQRICTQAFMQEVRDGTVWCPKKDLIKAHTCAQAPTRREL
jgi:hypothetical protein